MKVKMNLPQAIMLLVALIALVVWGHAQSKPTTSTTPTTPASPSTATALAATIPVPPARALAIRDAQVEAMNVQSQLQQLVQQRDEAQHKMQDAIKAAYAEAKLQDTEYSIDDRKWVFVPTPKPPATPAPTPTPAAGAKK